MNTKTDQPNTYMQFPAAAYPWQHPYPVALRRVAELEHMLAHQRIVDPEQLTRYTATPHGGMVVDQDHGPWVLLRHATGSSRALNSDDKAALDFCAVLIAELARQRQQGRGGWDRADECSDSVLAYNLLSNVSQGDCIDIAIYAMMLWHRSAPAQVLRDVFFEYARTSQDVRWKQILIDIGQHIPGYRKGRADATADAEAAYIKDMVRIPRTITTEVSDEAEAFTQALIAQGWHSDDLDCVDSVARLLQGFLTTMIGKVPA